MATGLVIEKSTRKRSFGAGLDATLVRDSASAIQFMSPNGCPNWSSAVHTILRKKAIRQIGTVPDAGLTQLLDLCNADDAMLVMTLTREDEGIGLATGAWLGGERAALLMQSSGVGNVINALSLPAVCKTPCLMLVTMRGQWGETNGWQVPMGSAAKDVLQAMGVTCYPVDHADAVGETVSAAADMAFSGGVATAVLISQRVIGAKTFDTSSEEVR